MEKYDLIVIGSGPAGEKAAIQAAKLGKKVAIDRIARCGWGVCVSIRERFRSKTLRETVLYLAGLKQRSVYGVVCSLSDVTGRGADDTAPSM